MNAPEHVKTPHVMYWGMVRTKAEDCVKHVLEGGNCPVTMHDAIGKTAIESAEDWDDLIEFLKAHNCSARSTNKLYRAQVSWIQAVNELGYSSPAMAM